MQTYTAHAVLRSAGAAEFKKGFDEAVAKNTELLGDDPAAGEEAAAPAAEAPADTLASQTEKLAVTDETAKEKA